MTLWHAGRVIVSSPANTGISGAETELGTFPVFEHIPEGTMSGTNPDGSHYKDPGIKWISYFNGGDALHNFDRASFGIAAEPRLRRAPARGLGGDLALHADRHARHDRKLIAPGSGASSDRSDRPGGAVPCRARRSSRRSRRPAGKRAWTCLPASPGLFTPALAKVHDIESTSLAVRPYGQARARATILGWLSSRYPRGNWLTRPRCSRASWAMWTDATRRSASC